MSKVAGRRRTTSRTRRRGVVHPQRRVRAIFLGVLMVFSLFAAQLVRLQGLDAASVSAAAVDGRLKEVTVPAVRGTITDVNGVPLAQSIERKHVTADPPAVRTYTARVDGKRVQLGIPGAAAAIAEVIGTDPALLERAMEAAPGRFTYLVKDISPKTWQRVDALGIPGIHAEDYLRRTYPLGASHAPLVGWVGAGEAPAGGIEQVHHDTLTGTPGSRTYELGGLGEVITTGTSDEVPPVPGQDVRLTIDSDLQWYAYNAVTTRVQEAGALSGYAVVMDVETGQLLAAASYPAHDPAKAPKDAADLRNPLVEDAYEPGSTSKLITAAIALEEDMIDLHTPFVLPDRLPRAGTRFKDAHDPATPYVTFAGVLATSSNIGTILYGEHIPDDLLHDYQRRFGLGTVSGLGLPGESPGIVPPPSTWSVTSKFTMLYGQGVTSNALQQVGVFQTVANGGVHVPPSIVAGTTDAQGRYTPRDVEEGERVISEETATALTHTMEYVPTAEGTAPLAEVAGYRVAGKTSTADRVDPNKGRYSGVTSAFIGYAPADDPQYLVSVTIQRPTRISRWGGTIAGPVFSDIMRYTLQSQQVPPSTTTPPKIPLVYDPDAPAPDQGPGVTLSDIAIKDEGNG